MILVSGGAWNFRFMLWLAPLLRSAPTRSTFQSSLKSSCCNTSPYSEWTAEIRGSSIIVLSCNTA